MKTKFGLALILAVMLILSMGTVAFADDPDDVVTVTWSGSGIVTGSVQAGDDSQVSYYAGGTGISGGITVTDYNNNPYGYNVDTVTSYIQSSVTEGVAWYQVTRDDSTSMYGSAGQMSYSEIQASGGTAEMAMGSNTNFAQMTNATYGQPKTTSGKNFEASASAFFIGQWIGNGTVGAPTGNHASMTIAGSGTALVDCMSSETSGCWATQLGDGCGCYTNADAVLNGSGTFNLSATGTNGVTTPSDGGLYIPGDGSYGSCSYSLTASYTGAFTFSDYSIKAQ